MKIQKILKRLLQLHPKSEPSTLIRIKRLLRDLDSPEDKINNVVQVVGTNGKHSFCVTLREIIEKAGYTCNLNISPSLRKFNERYYFSGKYISDEELYNSYLNKPIFSDYWLDIFSDPEEKFFKDICNKILGV